ncbi:MAG UNVERIFIED_CONTAM: aldolase/citrate lyase family protein [Planctomycetaceae bacterium]|jgi:2-keto-3-deoxy-L-rhamnonate aldolase RhmA
MVQWIDRQRLASAVLAGTFLNLGSSVAVEIAAGLGFDWLLLDLEHGSGSWADLRPLLLAAAGTSAVPIVRVRSADADDVKFVMDSGAAGIMFPYIGTPAEAARAVSLVKYPPQELAASPRSSAPPATVARGSPISPKPTNGRSSLSRSKLRKPSSRRKRSQPFRVWTCCS